MDIMLKISNDDVKRLLMEYGDEEMERIDRLAEVTPPHRFSLRFRIRMRLLLWRMAFKPTLVVSNTKVHGPSPVTRYIPLKRMTIVFIAIILAMIGLCGTAIGVRNAFRLVEKVFPKYSDIRYENPVPQEQAEFEFYEFTYIPEGYVFDDDRSMYSHVSGTAYTRYYNDKHYFILRQQYAKGSYSHFNTENIELTPMRVNQIDGYYYSNQGIEKFTWIDDKYCLTISGTISQDTLFKLVESIKKQ